MNWIDFHEKKVEKSQFFVEIVIFGCSDQTKTVKN